MTSGSVNAYRAEFRFSQAWEGVERTAVFRAGETAISVPLKEAGGCTIPWEVLVKPHETLYAGVYWSKGTEMILPTVWASLGTILEGVSPGKTGQPPPSGGGGGDHRQLTGREAAEQHPVGAISGLAEALSRIPEPAEALTNLELEELLK